MPARLARSPRRRLFLLLALLSGGAALLLCLSDANPAATPATAAAGQAGTNPAPPSPDAITLAAQMAPPGAFAPLPPFTAPPPDAATAPLLRALQAGQPLTLRIGDAAPVPVAFRPVRAVVPGFRISLGPDSAGPATPVSTWRGRLQGVDGVPGAEATLAVIGPAFTLRVADPAGDWIIRRDPDSGATVAGRIPVPATAIELAESGPDATTPATLLDRLAAAGALPQCAVSPGAKNGPRALASTATAAGAAGTEPNFDLPARLDPPAPDGMPVAGEDLSSLDDETTILSGPAYDASLRDVLLLFVLDKATTGSNTSPAALSAKAADYVNLAITVAGVYEAQLGLRLLLQEIVLNPNTGAYTDPGQNLLDFEDWTIAHRPFEVYRWSHAARFGLVDAAVGGVIGRAYVGYTGTPFGLSECETTYGFTLFAHELGHSVGSYHTSGGVMNPTLIGNQRNFFRQVDELPIAITGAKMISEIMREPNLTFGTAPLRDAAEIPFGVDDFVATAAGTPVTFSPLANDYAAVPLGVTNSLRLVETGAVYPRHAGTVTRDGNLLTFTPEPGFSGVAWFSYTLGGDKGNHGRGWLHRADVQVTVGGNGTLPPRPPALELAGDTLVFDPILPVIEFRPLLNDHGAGARWAGDVSRVAGPAGNDAAYGGTSLALTGAELTSGEGSLALVARAMTADSAPILRPSGILRYTPPPGGLSAPAEVTYTVRDATGATGSTTVTLLPGSFINVFALAPAREETGEPGLFRIQPTIPSPVDRSIAFAVGGAAVPNLHYTLEGAASFNPATGRGTAVLPAGASHADLHILPLADGQPAPDRAVHLMLRDDDAAWSGEPAGASSAAWLPVLDADRSPSFTQHFPGGHEPFALAHRQLSFIPDPARGYRVTLHPHPQDSFPVDPAGGATLYLEDDDYAMVIFADGRRFPFAGQLWDRAYVGSNGYVTFGAGDTYMIEYADTHFNLPRISVLYDDLNPEAAGTVSYRQLPDRWVLTVQGVPEWSIPFGSSYQLELFWDGTIRMTWGDVGTGDALVGLSLSTTVPSPWYPDDFRWARHQTLLPSVNAWREAVFASLPGGASNPLAADDADPDGDGIPNLLEHAFGLDPLDPADAAGPSLAVETAGEDEFLGLQLRLPTGVGTGDLVQGYELFGVTYRVEYSDDLVTWHHGTEWLEQVASTPDPVTGMTMITVRARVPLAVAPAYLRLRAAQP